MDSQATGGSEPHSRRHFETLDGLRGIAAFTVLFYHRRWWIAPGALHYGYLAVDFFFILSGFVIAHAYWDRLANGRLKLAGFARLRMERLGPLVVLGATLGVVAQAAGEWATGSTPGLVGVVAAWPASLMLLPIPWFDNPFRINGPSWSLFFECAGNIIFAAIIPGLTLRRLAVFTAVLTVMLATIVITRGTISVGYQWDTIGWGFVRMLAPFSGGALLHRLWLTGRLPRLDLPIWLLVAVLLACIALVPPLPDRLTPLYQLVCVCLVFPLIVVAGVRTEPGARLRPLARLSAELSYPVYILHMPLLVAFTVWHGETPAHTRITLLGEAAAISIVALAASRLYEIPLRRMMADRRRNKAIEAKS